MSVNYMAQLTTWGGEATVFIQEEGGRLVRYFLDEDGIQRCGLRISPHDFDTLRLFLQSEYADWIVTDADEKLSFEDGKAIVCSDPIDTEQLWERDGFHGVSRAVAASDGEQRTENVEASETETVGQTDVAESGEYLYVFCSDSLEVRKLTRRTERSIYGDSKRYPLDRLHVTVFDDREEAINDYVEWIGTYQFAIPEDAEDLIRRLVRADLMTKEAEVDSDERRDWL